LGNPTRFYLSEGQVHDLEGSDVFLETFKAEALLADKAYDADERVLDKLKAQGKEAVIPPKSNRTKPRFYDKEIYKARHLIENFFAKLKNNRAIATRYDKLAATFLGAIYLTSAIIWLN
jgi:transposase